MYPTKAKITTHASSSLVRKVSRESASSLAVRPQTRQALWSFAYGWSILFFNNDDDVDDDDDGSPKEEETERFSFFLSREVSSLATTPSLTSSEATTMLDVS